MSKTDTPIIVALRAVVEAARTYASASLTLTHAAMNALNTGADVDDVIEAARGGFEEAGENFPNAWASNLRRVAAAGKDYVQAVIDSDRSLNNQLLVDLAVPKVATQGRKAKADAPKADAPKADPADPTVILRGLIAVKTKIVDIADVDRFENALTEALACLARVKAK